jgi:hypothetical protein
VGRAARLLARWTCVGARAAPDVPLSDAWSVPFADLEPLLERVSKPIQYVGGELNSTVKDWDCGGFGPTRAKS